MTKRDKITVEDIIGIVHTDEPTDSVEEVKKLRGRTNERFELVDIGFVYNNDKLIGMKEIVDLLNSLNEENEQLKDFIRKEFPKSHKHILEGFE